MEESDRKKHIATVLKPETAREDLSKIYINSHTAWNANVVVPYSTAYAEAHKSFMKTMEDQKRHYDDMENLKFEFAVTVLAIAGGSVLTAIFADSALKVAAKEAAISHVCKHNMQRAFSAMHFVEQNAVPSFIAGKVWDESERALLDAAKKTLEPKTGNYNGLSGLQQAMQKPGAVLAALTSFNNDLFQRAQGFLWSVRELKNVSDKRKEALLHTALESKYLSPPTSPLSIDFLTPRLELTLFMQMLTLADQQRYGTMVGGMDGPGPVVIKAVDVPTTAPNYPNPATMVGVLEMPSVGNVILERIDELNAELYHGEEFFTTKEYWLPKFNGLQVTSIVSRAEQKLQRLAAEGHLGMLARGG